MGLLAVSIHQRPKSEQQWQVVSFNPNATATAIEQPPAAFGPGIAQEWCVRIPNRCTNYMIWGFGSMNIKICVSPFIFSLLPSCRLWHEASPRRCETFIHGRIFRQVDLEFISWNFSWFSHGREILKVEVIVLLRPFHSSFLPRGGWGWALSKELVSNTAAESFRLTQNVQRTNLCVALHFLLTAKL